MNTLTKENKNEVCDECGQMKCYHSIKVSGEQMDCGCRFFSCKCKKFIKNAKGEQKNE